MTQNDELPTIRQRMDKRAQEIAEDHRLRIKNRRDGQTYVVPPLPEGVELKKRDDVESWMKAAFEAAKESDDPSTQVGAVLVYELNGRVQARSHNTLPHGVEIKTYRRERPIKYKWTAHAEERLIAQCARLGIICDEAIVATTHHPCSACARILIEAGIKRVYYHTYVFGGDWLEDCTIARHMLYEAGVEVIYYTEKFPLDE